MLPKYLMDYTLSPYLNYMPYCYQQMNELIEQECLEIKYAIFLQSPLEALIDNLEAHF